ncbi:XRE family transcriptional regulator [Frisingicoccus sp.]|uniref:XRE family transcriptional regulator n=1 Tax=Frisingicoccus sp. TaxID=1918627 RepID=UPI003AB470F7
MIGEKLKEIRESVGMNKKEFAQYLGLKYTTYNGYETEAREPASDFLILFSEKFDVSIDYLLGLKSNSEILHSYQLRAGEYEYIKKYRELDPYGQETVNMIMDRELNRTKQLTECTSRSPAASLRIYTYMHKIAAAGNGYYFDDIPTDTIEAPYKEGADFIIGVSGDSMEPTYNDGDLVYVEKSQVVNTGDIGIFMLNNECYIKEAGESGLISHNSKYDLIPGNDNIHCIGKVLGKVDLD